MSDSFVWPDGKRCAVCLTFDDARLSQVDRGLPILDRHGVKATFYVSPGNVGQRLTGWKAAVAAGHEIGNHTVNHPCTANFCWSRANALEDYTLSRMRQELLQANDMIRASLGVTPVTFAYPCGQTYLGRGRNTVSYVPLVAELFRVGRCFLNETHNDPAFCDLAQTLAAPLDGKTLGEVEPLLRQAKETGGWLIFAGHEVGDEGRQTTLADTLDSLCRYASAPDSGVWMDTAAAVGAYIAETLATASPHPGPLPQRAREGR